MFSGSFHFCTDALPKMINCKFPTEMKKDYDYDWEERELC